MSVLGRGRARRALLAGALGAELTYEDVILSTGPIALWGLGEGAGATSVADSAGGFTGTPANVTFGAATFPDGTLAPSFNGTNSYIDVFSAGLASAFTGGNAGSMAIWCRPTNAGVWTDATNRMLMRVGADVSNALWMLKSSTANSIVHSRVASGTSRGANSSVYSAARWYHVAFTWNSATGQLYHYTDGVQYAGSNTSTQAFVGALTNALIGANTISALVWSGNLKHAGIWNRELTQSDVNTLYVPGYAA